MSTEVNVVSRHEFVCVLFKEVRRNVVMKVSQRERTLSCLRKQLIRVCGCHKHVPRIFGKSALAEAAGLSRQQLSAVLAQESQARPHTVKGLLRATITLEVERSSINTCEAAQIEHLKSVVQRNGIVGVAKKLHYDPSNLTKVLRGERKMPADLALRFARRFGQPKTPSSLPSAPETDKRGDNPKCQ